MRLESAGLQVVYMELILRPTPLPTGMQGWLETFALLFTRSVEEVNLGAFLKQVTEKLRPALCDSAGDWTVEYVRYDFWLG